MATESHTDPLIQSRTCKTCHVWLPCCVIDEVAEHAAAKGVTSSDVILAALRQYLDTDFSEEVESCCAKP